MNFMICIKDNFEIMLGVHGCCTSLVLMELEVVMVLSTIYKISCYISSPLSPNSWQNVAKTLISILRCSHSIHFRTCLKRSLQILRIKANALAKFLIGTGGSRILK